MIRYKEDDNVVLKFLKDLDRTFGEPHYFLIRTGNRTTVEEKQYILKVIPQASCDFKAWQTGVTNSRTCASNFWETTMVVMKKKKKKKKKKKRKKKRRRKEEEEKKKDEIEEGEINFLQI